MSLCCPGLRQPVVRWRRPNGQPLPPGHSVNGGVLYIPRITSDYQGEYQCVVTSTLDRQNYTTSVILIVTGQYHFIFQKLKYVIPVA